MPRETDITGMRYGRLLVVGKTDMCDFGTRGAPIWRCLCDCGNEVLVTRKRLRDKKSCGCLLKEQQTISEKNPNYRHGENCNGPSRLSQIYHNMIERCNNPNNTVYPNYGGRGITVCDEWQCNSSSFFKWAHDHGYRDGLTIDRVDVDAGYSPENCRFVDRKIQGNNTRRNHYITYNGKTLTMAEWADETGIPYYTLRSRINILHWAPDKALTHPVREMHYQSQT